MENALSCNAEESFKQFLDPDPKAGDFQNLTSSCPQNKYISRYISGKDDQQFIREVEQTDRQRNKQTNAW